MSSNKKVLLITGGNTGLGLEAVKAIYASSHAYEIIIGCRTLSKGEEAASSVKSEIPKSSSTLSVLQVDISSDDSINKAVQSISSTYGRLDILVNNAGANFDGDLRDGKLSEREAFNKSWDTNVAGTQVLTSAAAPLLLKSSDARLLFITSGTSTLTETVVSADSSEASKRINASPAAGWPKDHGFNPLTSYRSTKCGLNMLMREWNRLLGNDGVKVWAVSPGFLATGLAGIGKEKLLQIGAIEPHIGGEVIRNVVEGKRDADVGMVVRRDTIQPW